MGTQPTAVAYLRISSDPQDRRLGVDAQNEDVRALADQLGVQLVRIFKDNDVSASKVRAEKTEWAACLRYVRSERPAYLLGTWLDRLGRRLTDIEGLDDLARETGLRVYTAHEGDVFANPMWPIMAALAKTEAQRTRDRIIRRQEGRRAKGLDSGGGWRPFGFEQDRLTVIDAEAEVIREMARRVISGESATQLAFELNRRGVKPVSGAIWKANVLRRVIGNPRYGGYQVHRGKIIGRGAWPSILDKQTYELLQHRLAETARPRGGPSPTTLLGGIVRCGLCETPMTSTQTGATSYRVYRCNRREGGCGKVSRKQSTVDQYVGTFTRWAIIQTEVADERRAVEAELHQIDEDLEAIEARIKDLRAWHHAGKIPSEDYYVDLDRLRRSQRDRVKLRRDALAAAESLAGSEVADDRWESWNTAERRRFIRSLLTAVIINPAKNRGRAAAKIVDGEIALVPRAEAAALMHEFAVAARGHGWSYGRDYAAAVGTEHYLRSFEQGEEDISYGDEAVVGRLVMPEETAVEAPEAPLEPLPWRGVLRKVAGKPPSVMLRERREQLGPPG